MRKRTSILHAEIYAFDGVPILFPSGIKKSALCYSTRQSGGNLSAFNQMRLALNWFGNALGKINTLGMESKVWILWVQGYVGNEGADELAKNADPHFWGLNHSVEWGKIPSL